MTENCIQVKPIIWVWDPAAHPPRYMHSMDASNFQDLMVFKTHIRPVLKSDRKLIAAKSNSYQQSHKQIL